MHWLCCSASAITKYYSAPRRKAAAVWLLSSPSWEQRRIQLAERIERELDGHRREEQAHNAHGDIHRDGAEPPGATRGDAEDEVAHHADDYDAEVERHALAQAGCLVMQQDGRRNGP